MKIFFGERLKQLRLDKNLTQSQLAKDLQTTQRKVSYWEAEKIEPDLISLCNICDYFGVSADYILGRKDY